MSALPHCQVGEKLEWSDNRNYTILHFATLPTCNCFFENFSAFNTTYRYIRQRYKKCMLWLLSPDIYKTQQGSHCETIENEATVFWNQCVIMFEEYLYVCDFLSSVDESYFTDMLTFMNRMADIVLHNSYCSSWPMKWHAGRFLYSTVNMLCGNLNRLLNVWQCTEIMLSSKKWGVLQTHSKVTVLRYPLLLLIIVIDNIIIIIIITIYSAHPNLALQKDKLCADSTLYFYTVLYYI